MEIVIRKGTYEDTENFIRLLQEIREGMDQKEWFYLDPPEQIRKMMKNGTMQLWAAMDGNRMAAALTTVLPGLDDCSYGYPLGFTQEQLLRVIHMDTAAVRPDYRGLGLQKKLLETAEQALVGAGERILLCTVHPDNRFSLNNVLKLGYTIQKEVKLYGSVRYILRKDIF